MRISGLCLLVFTLVAAVAAVEEETVVAAKQLRRRDKAQLFDVMAPLLVDNHVDAEKQDNQDNLLAKEDEDIWSRLLKDSAKGSMDEAEGKSPGWPWY